MTDIRDVRRGRLEAAIQAFGTTAEFARHHELDASYLSQILTGHRKLGEKSARKIEAAANLGDRFLDGEGLEHTEAQPPTLSATAQRLQRKIAAADQNGLLTADLVKVLEAALAMKGAGQIRSETGESAFYNVTIASDAELGLAEQVDEMAAHLETMRSALDSFRNRLRPAGNEKKAAES